MAIKARSLDFLRTKRQSWKILCTSTNIHAFLNSLGISESWLYILNISRQLTTLQIKGSYFITIYRRLPSLNNWEVLCFLQGCESKSVEDVLSRTRENNKQNRILLLCYHHDQAIIRTNPSWTACDTLSLSQDFWGCSYSHHLWQSTS